MRIHKVYTRQGDEGLTQIIGGERIPKDSPRIEAYGTIDELSSVTGMLRAEIALSLPNDRFLTEIDEILNRLFDLGNMLATPPEREDTLKYKISQQDIEKLESLIDDWNKDLPALRSFTLPGSGRCSAWAHIARTVCRRAERTVLSFSRQAQVKPEILRYLNRLSDLFFVLSRRSAYDLGEKEILWESPLEE